MPARRPLTVLLRLRGIEELRAAATAARAARSVQQAVVAAEQARSNHLRRPLADQPLSPLQLRAVQLQGMATADMVEAADAELVAMARERQRAGRELTQAGSRRKSVERLVDRRTAEAALAAGRLAERASSDAHLLRRSRPE